MRDRMPAVRSRGKRPSAANNRPAAQKPAPAGNVQAHIAAAADARRRGDRPGMITALSGAVDLHIRSSVPLPDGTFYELAAVLLQVGQFQAAERRIQQGLQRQPRNFALTNLLGVVLKNLGRYDEALERLAVAEKLDPASVLPAVNRGNIHLARRDGAKAVEAFSRAVKADPGHAEHHRLLGVAWRTQGDMGRALTQFEAARTLDPANNRAWIDAAALLDDLGRRREAVALLDAAIAARPDTRQLAEARLALLRRAGQQTAATAYARALVKRLPDQVWVHMQFARCVMHTDRRLANQHLREAVKLEPDNPEAIAELADSLDRTRGPDEGQNIEEAYELARRRLALGGNMLPHARSISSILNRACDFAGSASVGSFEQLTRHWAETNYISALHYQMAQVRSAEQRRLLLEAHRACGRTIDAVAARSPLARPAVRRGRAKVRVGLMSSDLRNHPVSYFALPVIEGYDSERYELYCYSWNSGPGDPIQQRIASRVDAFRLAPAISDRDAAALIAGDGLDILVELGGTTYMNKLNVMTWRPARIQASWVGYPHSAGPETIDYIVVDPYNRPTDDALLIEKPLVLPRSWVVLGTLGFNERVAIQPGTPQERAGHVTFGTMNNPYKFTEDVLATWAEVVCSVDNAHFLFVRPESATPAFRKNTRAVFEAHGVAPDRIEFVAVRGTHMPHYNKIDIALDTFPQTGGTTTCEALWMGVPTVSLAGPCFFERLSNSNLTNAGLADLCVTDRGEYVRTAVALAADAERRGWLRHNLRREIRQRPLGRVDWFVDDFMSTMRRAVDGAA